MAVIDIRPVRPGDENILSEIYCASWRSGFADLITEEVMDRYADYEKVAARYKELLKDPSRHGFGIKSIKYIAEQYGGKLTVSIEDNMFFLRIRFPLSPAK